MSATEALIKWRLYFIERICLWLSLTLDRFIKVIWNLWAHIPGSIVVVLLFIRYKVAPIITLQHFVNYN